MNMHDDVKLAGDPLTSPSILSNLAKSDEAEVRGRVAANPSTEDETLLSLVGDSNPYVIDSLRMNSKKLSKDIKVTSCKNIVLTLANVSDAEFILLLRQNEELNRFVSQVSPDLDTQRKWLKNYKEKEAVRSEFYFIIRDLEMNPLGTVRIYDFQNGSFCWGSWMVSPSSPRKTAIESALCVYEFAFRVLNFDRSHFDVRNQNEKVIKFHKRMEAEVTHSDDMDTFFIFKKEIYMNTRKKYLSFLNTR